VRRRRCLQKEPKAQKETADRDNTSASLIGSDAFLLNSLTKDPNGYSSVCTCICLELLLPPDSF
jgi:hypothetical protein